MSSHPFHVHLVPCLTDNYIFVLEHLASKDAVAIDPGKSAEVIEFVHERGLNLKEIWLTHHHWDHIGGVEELCRQFHLKVVGNRNDSTRLPKLTTPIDPEAKFDWHGSEVETLFLNGHTSQHIAYFFPSEKRLFSGDVIFSLGCGRLFEGTPVEMWNSLLKIRNLPNETEIYCTHEYTETNLGFVKSLNIFGDEILSFENRIKEKRAKNLPTVPTLLANEKRFNPFLKADDQNLKQKMGLGQKDEVEVFAEIRSKRNVWK